MEFEQLKEYVHIALDMETDIYTQDTAIAKLHQECEALGHERYFLPPPEFALEPPVPPKKASFGAGGVAAATGLTVFIPAAGAVYVLGKALGTHKTNKLHKASYEEELAAYEQAKQRHQESVAEYEKELADDRVRVQAELVRKRSLGEIIEMMEKERARAEENLQRIYSADVVFPKYRNLAMLASIHEYLCAKRCEDLPAAYNILEQEMLMNRIITGIQNIVERLDDIKQGQYMLYRAVMEGNQKAEELVSIAYGMAGQMQTQTQHLGQLNDQMRAQADTMERMGKSADLSAYYAEQIEKQTRYMSRMDYLTGRNSGVTFNIPPM